MDPRNPTETLSSQIQEFIKYQIVGEYFLPICVIVVMRVKGVIVIKDVISKR